MELTAKEIEKIEKARAKAAKTEQRKLARTALDAVTKAQQRAEAGLGGPFSLNGYKCDPQPDGSVALWRKGVRVYADLSVLAETSDAPAVESAETAPEPIVS